MRAAGTVTIIGESAGNEQSMNDTRPPNRQQEYHAQNAVPEPQPSQDSSAASWQQRLYAPLTILAWLAVVIVFAWLLGHVARTLLTIVLATILAFALTPLVSLFSRWMPRFLAILLAYIIGFAIIFGIGALMVITVSDQVTSLVHHLPDYAKQAQKLQPDIVRHLSRFGVTQQKLQQTQQSIVNHLQAIGTRVAEQSIATITNVVSTIVDLFLILILSVYLTANGPKIDTILRRESPRKYRDQVTLLIAIVTRVVGGYVRGTLTLALLIGFLVGIGMFVLGVPYAALLGVLAFFMEFIPILGVLISGAVCVVIAFISGGWVLALIVLGYFVVIHVIEGDVVGPRIMGAAVGIHPATALIALVAGTELFGIWGALFGAPIAGLIQAIGTAAWRELHGYEAGELLERVVEGESETTAHLGKVTPPEEDQDSEEAEEDEPRQTAFDMSERSERGADQTGGRPLEPGPPPRVPGKDGLE